MGKLPSYDEFVEVMKAQKEQVFENLEKTPNLKDILGDALAEHVESNEFWWLDSIATGILFDCYIDRDSMFKVSPEHREVVQSIKGGIQANYLMDFHLNDVLQELMALRDLINWGFVDIRPCRFREGVPKPDFECRRNTATYIVEVKNIRYSRRICDFLQQFLVLLSFNFSYEPNFKIEIDNGGMDATLTTKISSASYHLLCDQLLHWTLGALQECTASKNPVETILSGFHWLNGHEYRCVIELVADGFGGVAPRQNDLDVRQKFVQPRISRFRNRVKSAYEGQCRRYIASWYPSRSDMCSLVLVNFEIDDWLLSYKDELLSKARLAGDEFEAKYPALSVEIRNAPRK